MSDSSRTDPGPRRPAGGAVVLVVVAAGGVVGALARAGLLAAVPYRATDFPWPTFAVNVVGCLLIGALMVLLERVWTARPLLRPFLGVGVLGGFTTFSTYVLDVQQAVRAGAPETALAYLGATVLAALGAVWAGDAAAGWLLDRTRPGGAAR
ncbi:camphor resistance protein CrcB [Micromonospora pallida]|uniref:Fluoride-specific ion channel FluC n=1 Tax=Micromonospora pallida TaxID=145854 RepID=A0A1C6S646_9ACTN|nr:CrcB family protein [Micromonospora pallida]SCL24937.1 camphor resistance protein CrcB [Micromonospora pallida]